jgi:RimJ/RimL family protein N-acetyltransferase
VAFDPQPVLHGEHLLARPLRGEDFAALYEVARDPLLWEQHPASDRHRPDVFRAFFEEALASGGALLISTRDGAVIGSSRFHGYDPERGEVEIGWTFIARSHWGGATNRELKALMLRHAFGTVERVVFLVGPQNLRSQRALEKLGARRAGSRHDGSGQLSVLFELDRVSAPADLRPPPDGGAESRGGAGPAGGAAGR